MEVMGLLQLLGSFGEVLLFQSNSGALLHCWIRLFPFHLLFIALHPHLDLLSGG